MLLANHILWTVRVQGTEQDTLFVQANLAARAIFGRLAFDRMNVAGPASSVIADLTLGAIQMAGTGIGHTGAAPANLFSRTVYILEAFHRHADLIDAEGNALAISIVLTFWRLLLADAVEALLVKITIGVGATTYLAPSVSADLPVAALPIIVTRGILRVAPIAITPITASVIAPIVVTIVIVIAIVVTIIFQTEGTTSQGHRRQYRG